MSSHRNWLVNLIVLLAPCIFLMVNAEEQQNLLAGTDAAPGEAKYTVSLQYRYHHKCGGALITERHVLTAAHCFVDEERPYTKGLIILTGASRLNSGCEHHYAESVTVHPDFSKDNRANRWPHDIAVASLVTPAARSPNQAPVSLPSSDVSTRVTGVVSGWGALQKGPRGSYPEILQKRPATILPQAECNARHRILDTQLCTLDGDDTGVCHGDSGGPLVYNNEIVGVVSWAISCGIGYPDVYTRVWAYKDFITEAMKR